MSTAETVISIDLLEFTSSSICHHQSGFEATCKVLNDMSGVSSTPLSGKEDRRPIYRKRLTECYFRYMSQLLIRQSAPHLIETVNLKFDLDIQLAIVSRKDNHYFVLSDLLLLFRCLR